MPNYRSPGVYIEEVQAGSRPIEGVGTAIAAFVGITKEGPFNKPVKVVNWGQYVKTFGEWVDGAYLPHAVYQYFNNQGGACYVVRIGEDAAAEPQRASAELTSALRAGQAVYQLEAVEPGAAGSGITVRVERPGGAPTAAEAEAGEAAEQPEGTYTIEVRQGPKMERYEVSPRKGRRDLVTELQRSELVRATEIANVPVAERTPSSGEVVLRGGDVLPVRLTPADYLGNEVARSGFEALGSVEDATMVVVPDLMAAYENGHIGLDGVKAVQNAVISHCEAMKNRMAILDAPKGMNAQEVADWVREEARFNSAYHRAPRHRQAFLSFDRW
jgi:hypothetical protein